MGMIHITQNASDLRESAICNILLRAHPIGSYYWSDQPTSPEELFGGTWESITGCFIYAQDASHAVNTTGGEETHVLTVSELPAHKHIISKIGFADAGSNFSDSDYFPKISGDGKVSGGQGWNQPAGGDQPHNNMPPYRSAYCWRRTA